MRQSSSYFESLKQLNAEFEKAGKAPVKVRLAPENLESEDILEMVNAGLVKITVVDHHIAEFWAKIFPKLTLNKGATLRTGGEIAWMIRKDSPQLKAELNEFIARYPEGSTTRNVLLQKYLQNTKFAKEATSKDGIAKLERHDRFFPQVRRPVRSGLSPDDRPGLSGVAAQPGGQESGRGDRRHAGDAGYRQRAESG